jgi:hypothetical protein
MGAAAAVFAAGEIGRRARGYVLECPYRDLKTVVWNRLDNVLPPVFDAIAYQGLLVVAPLVLPELERITPMAAIAAIPRDVPVLILAGGRDRRARPAEARALFHRVRSHGSLMVFPEADHVRLRVTDPQRYRTAVAGFLQAVNRTEGDATVAPGFAPETPGRPSGGDPRHLPLGRGGSALCSGRPGASESL